MHHAVPIIADSGADSTTTKYYKKTKRHVFRRIFCMERFILRWEPPVRKFVMKFSSATAG